MAPNRRKATGRDAPAGTSLRAPANNQLAYQSNIGLIWREAAANPGWFGHTGAGSQMTHVTELNPATGTGYVLFTNEGLIDALVGPGSELNRTIHEWLEAPGSPWISPIAIPRFAWAARPSSTSPASGRPLPARAIIKSRVQRIGATGRR